MERRARRIREEKTRKVEQRQCPVHAYLYVVGEGCPKCLRESGSGSGLIITCKPGKPCVPYSDNPPSPSPSPSPTPPTSPNPKEHGQ